MALSYKLISVAGIGIELHITFLAFIIGLFIFNFNLAVLLLIVFTFVTLHELSHSLVALSKGIKVRRIVLLPIGGMAMIDTANMKPITEIQMSLAGPIFNFAVCYLLLGVMHVLQMPLANALDVIQAMEFTPELIIYYSFYANLILGSFNLLIPAFPLDGGRVFRSLLALKIDYVKATRIARNVSLVIAGALFVLAFMSRDLWIMIISAFIAFGASAEYSGLVAHTLLRKIKLNEVISGDFIAVSPDDRVFDVLPELISMKTLSVLVRTSPVSVADVRSVSESKREKKSEVTFREIAVKIPRFTARSSVEKIVNFMNLKGVSIVPVYEKDKIAGVVKRIDIERMKQVKEAFGN